VGNGLASERVIVAAPASFAGSAGRIWRITRGRSGWAATGLVTLAVLAIAVAWAVVLCWYALWGIWLIPWRILRRGQRKRKLATLRHRETMTALDHVTEGDNQS